MNDSGNADDTALSIEGPIGSSDHIGIRALLTCGHYAAAVHECSSDWDFPAESKTCPECGEERQYDLRVQLALMGEDA